MTQGHEIRNIILQLSQSNQPLTDIHIETDQVPRSEKPGGWEDESAFGPVTGQMLESFLLATWGEDYKNLLRVNGALDRTVPFDQYRLRINAFLTQEGKKLALSVRRHPLVPMSFEKIEINPHIKNLLRISSRGLFVVTGATGSGKTTTLASILDHYNRFATGAKNMPRRLHIHSIEDTIEYVHDWANCIVTQKCVGIDCPDFASGLRASLRQKAEIIMIGEVRDRETAETMLSAAESGHLVLATMHTNNAPAVITRILKFFPEDQHKMILSILAQNLLGISCQVMVPLRENTGWVVATESLINSTSRISSLISAGDTTAIMELMRKGKGEEYTYLNARLAELVKEGKVSADAAVRASYHPVELMESLKR